MRNILVTGAGALLGQGILRCLNNSNNDYNIISADPDERSTGHALANKSYLIPFANDEKYFEKVEEIIEAEKIDIILIGTDTELPLFASERKRLESKYGLKVVVADLDVIDITNDKWLTAEFLRQNNFPYPQSALTNKPNDIIALKNKCSYPFIAKPVDGARSKGIQIINSDEDMERICSYQNNLVVQELIGNDEGEYTTGCIVVDGKCMAITSLKRDLRDGNTWRAYRDGDCIYDEVIGKIAEALMIEGPANFQYRIRNGQPVVFEINGRFSGTTPLRMMFGFNEVEALIECYLNKTPIVQPQLKSGTVLRTFSDIFIKNEVLGDLKNNGVSSHFETQYFPFKK